jgi:hypothetical protein
VAHEKEWTIWLRDGSGEEPLGLQPTQAGTRFRVWGKMKEEAFGFGVWIEVQGVQELTLGANTVTQTWVIKPPTCLIPWSMVAYVQRGSASQTQSGFVAVPSKAK